MTQYILSNAATRKKIILGCAYLYIQVSKMIDIDIGILQPAIVAAAVIVFVLIFVFGVLFSGSADQGGK